jgi:hypothetical protein
MVKSKKLTSRLQAWRDACEYHMYISRLQNLGDDLVRYLQGPLSAKQIRPEVARQFTEGIDRARAIAKNEYRSAKALESNYSGAEDTFLADGLMETFDKQYNNIKLKIEGGN